MYRQTFTLLHHQIVIRHRGPGCVAHGRGMDCDVHIGLNLHRLIVPDGRPFDKVVSLSVGVQSPLGLEALLLWRN